MSDLLSPLFDIEIRSHAAEYATLIRDNLPCGDTSHSPFFAITIEPAPILIIEILLLIKLTKKM